MEIVHAEVVAGGILGRHADFHLSLLIDNGEGDGVGLHGRDERLGESGIEVGTFLRRTSVGCAALSGLLDMQRTSLQTIVTLGQSFQHLREAGLGDLAAAAGPCFHVVGAFFLGEIAVGLYAHAQHTPSCSTIDLERRVLDIAFGAVHRSIG